MSESPYRTAQPAEWPRSLRAAYAAGRAVSAMAPVWLFVGSLAFFGAMDVAIGYGAAFDRYAREPASGPPVCNVRSHWSSGETVQFGFALMRGDDMLGRFGTVDAALYTAARLGCTVVP